MKSPARILAALALAIFVLLLLFLGHPSGPSAPGHRGGLDPQAAAAAGDSGPAAATKTERPERAQREQASDSTDIALENLTREGRLLDSREAALPGPGERHTRSKLYETSFKYPAIRIDETWERQADGSERRLSVFAMVADHAMMRFPKEIDRAAVEAWCAKQGLTLRRKFVTDEVYLVQAPRVLLDAVEDLIARFKMDFDGRELAVAEPDYLQFAQLLPSDPQFSSLWGLHNTGQSGGTTDADIDAPEAWELHTGSRSVVVGVIDTGVERGHPDLAANIWSNPREIAGNALDDDGNGFIDDMYGWDFYQEDADPSDPHGHGTHCSGTIGGAGNNALGVAGVNWQVSIAGLRFLGPSGSGTTSDAVEAVNYARISRLTLTSNSWGGGGNNTLLGQAIAASGDAGQLFVAAAGNSSWNNDANTNYPSNYPAANIIAVAATTRQDLMASFSNFGLQSVDLAAPGADITSTWLGGSYAAKSGTSMATPHVAGAAALVHAMDPRLSAADVKRILMETVDLVPALAGTTVTGGRLNLFKALQSISGPRLIPSSVVVSEVSGNGDGIANPGETFACELSFRNGGLDPANGVAIAAAPQPAIPGVTVLESPYTPGDLAPGQVSPACRFTVVLGAALATPLNLQIAFTASDASGKNWTRSELLPVYTRCRISGQVTRADGSGPIEGATVLYKGPRQGNVTTDAAGRYEMVLVDGNYKLQASAAGFASSLERPVTVPPDASGIDFSLGIPDLQFSPESVELTLLSGTSATRTIQLFNQGNVPLTWQATAGPVASALTSDLIGVKVALPNSASSRSALRTAMEARGATVSILQLPLTSTKLAGLDIFILDDLVSQMSSTEIGVLRAWVDSGGSLLLEADDLASIEEINALLAGTGIQENYLGVSLESQISNFTAHPVTSGVTSLQSFSMGCECVVSGSSAKSIARDASSRTLAAVSTLNRGLVLTTGDELSINPSYQLGVGNQRFIDQAIGWLAARARWLRVNGIISGTVMPGESASVEILVNATLMDAGVYQSSLSIISNEPGNPRTEIPVTLTVIGAPAMSLSPSTLGFVGTTYLGASSPKWLFITNTGSDVLTIQSLESTHPAFTFQAALPAEILPRKTLEVRLTYTPTTTGSHSGTLNIMSNAPGQPVTSLPLSGSAAVGPVPAITPASLSAILPFGAMETRDLTISNSGDRDMGWSLNFNGGAPAGSDPLAETLAALDNEYSAITNLIPGRFDFKDGHAGNYIFDGNGNMYDEGNKLGTSTANYTSGIDYSDGVISAKTSLLVPFGTGGRFFTRKYPGLFVLAADNAQAISFQTSGGLGADGAGSVEVSQITLNHRGRSYRGFVKRVFGTATPSVNHLFIVRDNPSLFRTYSTNTNLDEHKLSGLQAGQRFYYLLYASANGSRIPDEAHREIMGAFLKRTVEPSSWLNVAPATGAVPVGQSSTVQAIFNAFDNPPGNYQGTLSLQHNGAGSPKTVPVSLQITPAPLLDLSSSTLQFPATAAGSRARLTFTVSNRGYGTLDATPAITGGAPAFTLIDATSFRLERGESRVFTVEFAPTAAGSFSGTLGFTGASTGGAPTLALLGEGLPAGTLVVAPNSLEVAIPAGSSTSRTLTISNPGAAATSYTAAIEDAAPFHTGRNLDGLKVLVVSWTESNNRVLMTRLGMANARTTFRSKNNITAADIAAAEVIFIDGELEYLSPELRPVLRAWCEAGGGLVHSLSSSSYVAQQLFAGTGLASFQGLRVTNDTVSQFESHVITRGLVPYTTGEFYADMTVSPPAKVIARLPDGRIAAAVSTIGRGRVVALTAIWPFRDEYADVAKAVELGVRAAEWTSRRRSNWLKLAPASGNLATGGSQPLTATIETAELDAGIYTEDIVIRSSNPADAPVRMPVRLVASGEPHLAVQPGSFAFPGTFKGHPARQSITLKNEGRAPLILQSADTVMAGLRIEGSFPLLIPPLHKSVAMLNFDPPDPATSIAGHLSLHTNAPGQEEVQVPVSGSVLMPPALQVPGGLTVTVGSGSTVAVPLTLGNAGGTPLAWQLAYRKPLAELPLEEVLATLDRSYLQVTAAIPNRYDFTGGFTGNSIKDGGAGMFRSYGNYLRPSTSATEMPYSDGVIKPADVYLGPGGRYFTRKYPGLFVFAADIKDLPAFVIEGGLSYATGNIVDGASLAVQRGNKIYRSFTKRARGGSLPSINHLFIMEDSPTLWQHYASSGSDEFHAVEGLETSRRLFYLLYSSSAGGNVDDTRTRQIIESFINAVDGDPTAWSGAPASGEIPASGSSQAQITVSTAGLAPGTYTQRVMVSSNDPARPLVEVPLTLQVLPPLTFSPAALNFGNVIRGDIATRTVTLTNTTTAPLNVSGGTISSGFFSGRFPASATLPAAGTLSLPVTFSPTADGTASGNLGLSSSAGALSLPVAGTGVAPGDFPIDGFIAWRNGHFPVGDPFTGLHDDPDGDGLDLAMEFAFLGDPKQPDAANPLRILFHSPSILRIGYTRRAEFPDTRIRFQRSAGLEGWTSFLPGTPIVTPGTGGTADVELEIPHGGLNKFFLRAGVE